ncbi:type II CAAX prenyl endopeptidase Rce1 family protein [Telmatobacter bradus]|uniref:CPBP family glutamic-type intramembrane protease n=1 Tax=Telmatobacter bradus TaxID=474953 RepID=UPI003B430600
MRSLISGSRLRAYFEFLLAAFFFMAARYMAAKGADAWASEAFQPLAEQFLMVVFLLIGFAVLGWRFDSQAHPISGQGLPLRPGWQREAGLGMVTGWGMAVVCMLPLVLLGGVAVSVTAHLANWGWLLVEIAFFALLALAEEIAFRGYAFQRFAASAGNTGAAIAFAIFYAMLQAVLPGASHTAFWVGIVFSLLLSTAYLRTHALWVSWGVNFGWKASRALLFGLAVNGVNSHSPIVQGDPLGSFWLSGGAFGLDASWLAFFVLLLAFPALLALTSELNDLYNPLVIEPGGVAVDLDAIQRAQHEAASTPVAPPLVQILPAAPAPPLVQLPTALTPPPGEEAPSPQE